MKANSRNTVAEFILRQTPKDLVLGLGTLAGIRTPLHDKRALEVQLTEFTAKAEGAVKAAAERVARAFGPSDFPILSTESALEKYWDKLGPIRASIPLPVPPARIPAGPVEHPPVCELYQDAFPRRPDVADCACRSYQEALREGMNEYLAIIIGHFAGRRMQRTGACPI